MRLRNLALVFALVASSSASAYFVERSAAQQPPKADNDYQIGATLYMQKAAEYRALAYQAFNIAQLRLDADFDKKNLKLLPKEQRKMPRAVMVDIDETMLDNSPEQARRIIAHEGFDDPAWYAWGKLDGGKAKPIPGSVEFVKYAVSRGVKVFFVSNRDEVQKPETMANLVKAGFPDVTSANVLLRQKDDKGNRISTKEPRRELIRKDYRIVLFIGDNLDDQTNTFEKKSVADRFSEADRLKADFGKRYIMLPNAIYGTWENAIYDHNNKLTDAEKAKKRAAALELP